jgi:BioD-like phosphotransacetylase family protein
MANLYVTSAETFSGKSAICIGVGLHMREDGLKVGYMKPVNINCQLCGGLAFDEDVEFAKKVLEMPESVELLGPVALTPAKLEQQLRGPETDYEPRVKEAFAKVSAGRDVMVLEGGRSLREGYVVNLMPKHVVEVLNARALAVLRYDADLMVDRALTAQWYFDNTFLGLVINEVPRAHIDHVMEVVVPYLTRHNIKVLAVLPREQLLSAPTVSELAEGLKAEILCCAEGKDELVEHMLVGAMSVEGALSYFRRKPNKAVITGGDRADIQLAALETSTRCLILTGNLYPSPVVLNRAEELGVPVLLVDMDTLSTIEIIEGYFGRSRFQQPQKIAHFAELLNEHFNFEMLYESLSIKAKK